MSWVENLGASRWMVTTEKRMKTRGSAEKVESRHLIAIQGTKPRRYEQLFLAAPQHEIGTGVKLTRALNVVETVIHGIYKLL